MPGFGPGSTDLLSGFAQVKAPLKTKQVDVDTLQSPSQL